MADAADITYLRLLVADRVRPGVQNLWDDTELGMMIDRNYTVKAAAAEAWAVKAAEYSELIDMDESGSSRKLSQRYEHAVKMANYYLRIASDEAVTSEASARLVGRVASILGPTDSECATINEYIGEEEFPIQEIHPYPTVRMKSVLG